MKSPFHMKGWAPRLALKKRLTVIRKCVLFQECRKLKKATKLVYRVRAIFCWIWRANKRKVKNEDIRHPETQITRSPHQILSTPLCRYSTVYRARGWVCHGFTEKIMSNWTQGTVTSEIATEKWKGFPMFKQLNLKLLVLKKCKK